MAVQPPSATSLLRKLWAARKYWLFPVLTLVAILLALAAFSGEHSFLPFTYRRF